VARFGEPVDQGGGEVRVLQERGPLAKAQVGGNEGGAMLVALLQESEEKPDLRGLGLDVANLIDQKQVVLEIPADDPPLGTVGLGAVQFIKQIGKEDVTAASALMNGLNEEARRQAGLAAAGAAHPDDVLLVRKKGHGVVEGHDLFLAQLGLTVEGECIHHPPLRNLGVFEALLASLIAFDAVFLLDDAGQKPGVGKVGLSGGFQVFIPAGQKAGQMEILELLGQGVIHHSGRGRGCR